MSCSNLTGQGGDISLSRRKAELGYCLLIDLFISFNSFFYLSMVIKYLKGFRSQFPLASCAVPYYKPCA